MHQVNLQKTSQDKLDLLMRQMKKIQTEMNILQEQQGDSDSLSFQQPIQEDSTVLTTIDPSRSIQDTVNSNHQSSTADTQDSLSVTQTTQPIPKPKGNYVNMPKTLKISKIKHNDYQNHIRDLVKLHVDLNKEYKKQSPKAIEVIISKFKKRNQDFPDTVNDWAIKMMIKRVINNIRDYRRKGKEEYENKKTNKALKNAKNEESSADVGKRGGDSYDNSDEQNNGSSSEMVGESSDKNEENNSEEGFFDKIIKFAENSRAKKSKKNSNNNDQEKDRFIRLLKEFHTPQIIDENEEITSKSDDCENDFNTEEVGMEIEQKQKTLPAKRKQMDKEVTNTKNKKIQQEKKQNRPVRKLGEKKYNL